MIQGPGRQLEMFPRYLEGIPDYKERLAALDYYREYERSTDAERAAKFEKIRGKMNPPYYREDSIISDVNKLNRDIGFPIVSFDRSDTPDSRGRYVYRIGYKNSEQVYEYAKKILDKNGEILPSKYQEKRA